MKTIREDGKLYITFPIAEKLYEEQVAKVRGVLQRLISTLTDAGYNVDNAFLMDVIANGAKSLRELAVKQFREWAESVKMPEYLKLSDSEKRAAESVPFELAETIEDIRQELRDTNESMYCPEDNITVPSVNIGLFNIGKDGKLRYRNDNSPVQRMEVSEQEYDDAQTFSTIIKQLQPLEIRGYEVLRVIRGLLPNRYDATAGVPEVSPEILVLRLHKPLMKAITYEQLTGPGADATRLVTLQVMKERELYQ